MNKLKGVQAQPQQEQPKQEQPKEEQKISINRRLTMTSEKNVIVRNGSPGRYSPLKTRVNGTATQQQPIQQVSNNSVQAVAFKSAQGKIPGTNKVNQDAYILANSIKNIPYLHFYAVADGHGQFGREVSSFIKSRLPNLLGQDINIESDCAKALRTNINKVASDLQTQNFDTQFSGSTLVTVLINQKKLYCANVGDSRAILVRNEQVIPLSRDHKPELKEEADRIRSNKGRVMAYKDENGNDIGPLRV